MFLTKELRQFLLTGLVLAAMALFTVTATHKVAPESELPGISARDAHALLGSPDTLVIDVRERDNYADEHIPGAINVPQPELQAALPSLAASKTQKIVVYCGDGSSRGPQATRALLDAGFAGAMNLKGGMPAWRAEKLPLDKS
ncbi:MAG: rhodanese-like domain-containing protein [Rhodocyclaceae bacterium]|nr:rhodanese-like domain-containing protein [Rhodocyclaceae bacterium]MBX3668228.1 rhodanese-like domain-containing protein [Rhodocyclaceae bacterium]